MSNGDQSSESRSISPNTILIRAMRYFYEVHGNSREKIALVGSHHNQLLLFQILATHGVSDVDIPAIVDVKDKDGHTVLHTAILEEWGPGVSAAIEAGANIIARVSI